MKYFIANWKSHKNLAEAEAWLDEFYELLKSNSGVLDEQTILGICVPFSLLAGVYEHPVFEDFSVWLGVQDISPFPAGSYTGAVSAKNLEGLGVSLALVGHSERRRYFGESHRDVANKVSQLIENNIVPLVCVDDEYIEQQANALSDSERKNCLVAYEELSAIGTGKSRPAEEVESVVLEIRTTFEPLGVLYGGSVSAENSESYLSVSKGVLVGSASLKPSSFMDLILAALE